MIKRLTIEFVREQFLIKGLELISTVYKNNKQQLNYKCKKCGYIGMKTYNDLRQSSGSGCPACINRVNRTIEVVREGFLSNNMELISAVYKKGSQYLKYRCLCCGYCGTMKYNTLLRGCGCPSCAGNLKHSIEFIREEFLNSNLELFSMVYNNNKQKLKYRCLKCGYIGAKRYDNLLSGRGCPECKRLNELGENNPNYNPALTNEDRINRRYTPDYAKWSYAVKKYGNFTCQICGDSRGGNLISHHLESYNNNPDLRIALDNGICLCEKCHKKFHSMYGYGNNTREQFVEFINKYNRQERLANV